MLTWPEDCKGPSLSLAETTWQIYEQNRQKILAIINLGPVWYDALRQTL